MTDEGAVPSRELEELLLHMAWADELVWREVLSLPDAGEDGRIRELLYHVHAVQRAYLQLLRGEPVEIPEPDDFQDLPSIHEWGRRTHGDLRGYLDRVDADALARTVEFPWAEQVTEGTGRVHAADARQALLQVTAHSTYHRGQINTRVRELGGEPPLTDFIAWVWAGGPDPKHPPPPSA